jgi:hypothetical protein
VWLSEMTDTVWQVRSAVGVSRDRSFKPSSFIGNASFLIYQRPVERRLGFHFVFHGRDGTRPLLLTVEVSDSYHFLWIGSALSLQSLFRRETVDLLLYSCLLFAFSVPFGSRGTPTSSILKWRIQWSTFSLRNTPQPLQYQPLRDFSRACAHCFLSASPWASDADTAKIRLSTRVTNPANTERQRISAVVQSQTAYIW